MIELAPGLFTAEGSVRFYGVRIPLRMAALRLPPDRLLLYSPLWLDASLKKDLDALGRVEWIVAPNAIHNQTLADYRDAYPAARLLAPPGLPERCPDLRFDGILTGSPDPAWDGEVEVALTAGNVFFCEALMLHHPSRTLLVGDLVENFEPGSLSAAARAAAALFGVRSRPMASPEFRLYTHDADAAERALAPVRAWEFDRIFLCHGRLIEHDARAVFGDVCRELIVHARRRKAPVRRLTAALARLQ